MSKNYPLAIVLSAYAGVLVTEEFNELHEFFEYMTGGPVWTLRRSMKTTGVSGLMLKLKSTVRPLKLSLFPKMMFGISTQSPRPNK